MFADFFEWWPAFAAQMAGDELPNGWLRGTSRSMAYTDPYPPGANRFCGGAGSFLCLGTSGPGDPSGGLGSRSTGRAPTQVGWRRHSAGAALGLVRRE